ncbi:MAG: T9SS type A sorting domain-containing protein [Bacteroidota bacterium]
MKRLLITFSLLLTFFSINFDAKAARITAITNSGAWNSPATWDRGIVPSCGDTIDIPGGLNVVITETVNLDDAADPLCPSVQLNISGTLRFGNGKKLNLAAGACINVLLGGQISPSKTGGGASERIMVGGVEEWRAGDGTLTGVAQLGCAVILPNVMVSFNASSDENVLSFSWSISEETNINSYLIEKSSDGLNWEQINETSARNENLIDASYSADTRLETIEALTYYKLFAVNLNGQKSQIGFTSLNNLEDLKTKELLIAPNPANGNSIINILSSEKLNKNVSLTVLNQLGQTIKTLELDNEFNDKLFSLENLELNSGTYTVFLNDGTTALKSKLIIL